MRNGSLWHTAAANRTDAPRPALTINFCVGFVRQQVNQQLSIPRELVRCFEPRLQELIGYGYTPERWAESTGDRRPTISTPTGIRSWTP